MSKVLTRRPRRERACACDAPVHAQGLCRSCYFRMKRGTLVPVVTPEAKVTPLHAGPVRLGDVFGAVKGASAEPLRWYVWDTNALGIRLRLDPARGKPKYLTVDETTLRVDYRLLADNPGGRPVRPALLTEARA